MKVDILLASYNGEKYIRSQILSIISQTYEDWTLIIHDDGSSDKTVEIIKNMMVGESRIQLKEDGIKYGSAATNFIHLLDYSNAPYVMFCDQDDIWFDNKIEIMLKAVMKFGNRVPVVVYSNAYVWYPEKGIKGLATITFPQNLRQFLFLNSGMQGCVSIFNQEMKKYLQSWTLPCAMHDHVLHLVGLSLGVVEYLSQPLMLYRQHQHSVTGHTSVSVNDIGQIINNRKIPVVDKNHYEDVKQFYQTYSECLSLENQKHIKDFLNLPSEHKIIILFKVLLDHFQLYNSVFRLMAKIILRPFINK